VLLESWQALSRIGLGRLLGDASWHPAPTASDGQFNMLPMILGSLVITLGAILLAAPLGVLSALFCRYYAPPALAGVYRQLVGLLGGIPSVVYGFWGLVVLVPLIQQLAPPGPSLLAGTLVLALMILPTVTLLVLATLETVPQHELHGAAALGLSRWTTLTRVLRPRLLPGFSVAVVLGVLRAIGETMAVLMVAGNVVAVPHSVFDPVRTLTANIALELGYATRDHRSVLFVSGLALMVMILFLVLAQERLQRRARLG
jgi:phosphate transport system permease protein